MKAEDLRTKTDEELHSELQSLLREQFNLRMQNGMGQLPQVHRLKTVRRDIARIKTIQNEKRVTQTS